MPTLKPKLSSARKFQFKYGLRWPHDAHESEIEAACYLAGRSAAQGGLGRFDHFKRWTDWHFEGIEWNPWFELANRSLCDDSYVSTHGKFSVRCVAWTGCGAAGKTHSAGFFAFNWWLVSPGESSVTLTSTSKTAIGQRVWPVFQRLFNECIDPDTGLTGQIGHLIDSKKMIQAEKGDEKHAIHALAVERGELQKSINALKGRHTPRMMLVVDEANTTPQAVFETIPNMAKGCRELVILVIGNAISRFDNHGRCCAPRNGWQSISVADQSWPTLGVPEWEIEPGLCVHFDGEQSPNVIGRQTKWPYLYTYENYLKRRVHSKSIQYWSQDRGFWPVDGLINTVLSEVMIEKYGGRGALKFVSRSRPVAALDPAFGGDGCIAQFGRVGDVDGGKDALCLTEFIEIESSAESSDEIDYQVARRFIELCKDRGVEPRDAGIDATGTGRGVYAIVSAEWSSEVHRVEFGGAPSEMPASDDDPRPAREVYDRKVTELWYSIRELLKAGQLAGLYDAACIQFCTREFSMRGRYIRLDDKVECKQKLGRSPDHADAIAVLGHVVRTNGLRIASEIVERRGVDWASLRRSADDLGLGDYTEANAIADAEGDLIE